jgi:hypothetical protein
MEIPANAVHPKILGANDGFPAVRKATRHFRDACKARSDVRWRTPKQLLAKDSRNSPMPLSWIAHVFDYCDTVSVTPDQIIGFTVGKSAPRILLLSVDYGGLPVESLMGDSLFLRTQALTEARDRFERFEPWSMYPLIQGWHFVAWIMHNLNRLNELSRLCAEKHLNNVLLIDHETFFAEQDPLAMRWYRPGLPAQSIV